VKNKLYVILHIFFQKDRELETKTVTKPNKQLTGLDAQLATQLHCISILYDDL